MSPRQKKRLVSLEWARRKALANYYYFTKYVLGYDLMEERVHGPLCSFVKKGNDMEGNEQLTKLILMPRNSFKSRTVTISYPLWRLINNPNLTFLITNEKLDKSKEFLREIKGHITTNKKFRMLFGDLSGEKKWGKKWSETRIDIATKTTGSGTATIEVSSAESSEAGKHVDILICDDLVGQGNSATQTQLDKVIEYYKDLGSVLKPGGLKIVIGTRWDYRDLYQYILDIKKHLEDSGGESSIEIFIKKAILDDGTLYFPEVLSKTFLDQRRAESDAYFFSCQYLNNPVGKENALVQRVDYYGDTICDEKADKYFDDQCNHFVTVDLAYTVGARRDKTVIMVVAVDRDTKKRYVRHYYAFQTTRPQEVIDKLFEVHDRYHPLRYGIESNNYKSWLKVPLEEAMAREGKYLNIDPEDGLLHYGKNQNKILRLIKVAPVFNRGDCMLHESMRELEDQLRLLTYGGVKGHDDLLDALAMLEEIIFHGNADVGDRSVNDEASMRKASGQDYRMPDWYDGVMDDEWMEA